MTHRFAKYPAQPFLHYAPELTARPYIAEVEQHYYPHRAIVSVNWDQNWLVRCECGFQAVRYCSYAALQCLEAHRRANDDGTGVPL